MEVKTIYPQKDILVWNEKKARLDILDGNQSLLGFIPKEELGFKDPVENKIEKLKERKYFSVLAISDMKWSRKAYQNERKSAIKVGETYIGVIVSTAKFGLFVEVLGDVEVFINCSQTSRVYNYPNRFFKRGEKIDVKILEKYKDEDGRVLVNGSRKEADTTPAVKTGEVSIVRIARPVKGGYFCEVTPNTQGVIDTWDNIEEGEEVVAVIKRITSNGYIHLVPYDYYR